MSDIETTSTNVRCESLNNSYHRKTADISIDIADSLLDNHMIMSEDAGYLSSSYSNPQIQQNEQLNKPDNKHFRDHIFTRNNFQSFECNELCCMTYIQQLFVVMETDNDAHILSDSITSDFNDESNSEDNADINRKILSRINKNKKRISVNSTKTLRKLLLQNTTVVTSGCRIRKNNARECKISPTQSANNRMQTPHMKSYIALRQQCRINDDLSPLSRTKVLIPYFKSPVELGGVRKSKLKRKKAFKMLNESDSIGKVRQKILRKTYRDKIEEDITDFLVA